MKAIQSMQVFNNLVDAQSHFDSMSVLNGFLGGRVYQELNKSEFKVQLFFECDQSLEYGDLYEDSEYRVCLILDGQANAVGIGNPYTKVNPQTTLESRPQQEIEVIEAIINQVSPEIAKQVPIYKVRFPTTDADAKKVLSYFRRQYKGELNRPILENFKEKFDSCLMTVIVNNKVQEVQRVMPINGKPNPDTFLQSAKNFHASIAHHGYTLTEVIWVMEETNIRQNEAIGKVLARM